MVELQIKDRRGNIIKYQLGDGRHVLGKSRVCDILLMDQYVSRRHAELLVIDDKVFLQDMNSTNGTWKGRKKLAGVSELAFNEVVRMGDLKLSVAPLLYQFALRPGHPCDLETFRKNNFTETAVNILQLRKAGAEKNEPDEEGQLLG